MAKRAGLSFSELCASLHRGPHFIRHLQQSLGLPLLSSHDGYSKGYRDLLDRAVYLRIFGVPLDDISSLFELEKKLLQLLRVDTASAGNPLWYLEWSGIEDAAPNRLLLTRFDLGPYIRDDGSIIQMSLDFGTRSPELFKNAEMGVDIRHVYSLYREQLDAISRRLRDERNVVRDALAWVSEDALRKT